MRRRRAIALLAGSLLAPASVRAQETAEPPLVGYMTGGAATPRFERAFLEGLREANLAVGRDVRVEFHAADGEIGSFRAIARTLIERRPSVIATLGRNAAGIVHELSQTVPIVVVAHSDPLNDPLIAGLVRPGGSVTGFSLMSLSLDGKRPELLRDLVPGARNAGVLFNPNAAAAAARREQLEVTARRIGLTLIDLRVSAMVEVDRALAGTAEAGLDGLIVIRDFVTESTRERIVQLVARRRLPAIYDAREFVDAGGLLSYGPDIADLHRRVAGTVARILRGARPADLPIEQAERFSLVVNARAAANLGRTIPTAILLRADEVIE